MLHLVTLPKCLIWILQLFRLVSFEGIWPDGADGTDVNSVDRSHNKRLLATGDDFGNVNLYRYPCVSDKVYLWFCCSKGDFSIHVN